MKNVLLTILVFATVSISGERGEKYWIYFTQKDPASLSKLDGPSIGISERAIQRRAKMGITSLSPEDLPVSESFVQQLRDNGIVIENRSRWFNAVTAYVTSDQIGMLGRFPFVKEIEPVRTYSRKKILRAEPALPRTGDHLANAKLSYGSSLTQMTLMNAVAVHAIGISGRGVLVGILDSGFRWREHEALKDMKVVAEYDFVQKDTVTENQAGDRFDQDAHGTYTMSLVGAFKDGELVSPAYNAYFMLGKTEYVPTETNTEEDNWVAGIEWMEQNGVDVVSSSLGYSEFDPGEKSYTYADMNGRTTTTTVAAAIAARKGVVVVNAMGNEAAYPWKYLTAPADADSIISVGAVSSNGAYAGFSSLGPTSDGRIKPDVAALGVGNYCAVPPGKISNYSNAFQGTSLATPLVAGVAAMILSARPELTPVQVRDALRNTASNVASPNNQIGWGIVNAYDAVLYYGMVISTDPQITITADSNYSIGFTVVSPSAIQSSSVTLFYSADNGATYASVPMTVTALTDSSTSSGTYTAVVPGITAATEVKFYVQTSDQTASRTSPYNAPAQVYSTTMTPARIITAPPAPRIFALKQNYPNPFNPVTTISYDLPVNDVVTLTVYDILGKEVARLVNGFQQKKAYSVPFNGAGLASGIYFYRLQTTSFSEVKKMVLLK